MPLRPLPAVLLSLQLVAPVLPPLVSGALAKQQRELTWEPGHSGWVPASPMASAALPDGAQPIGGASPPGALRAIDGPLPFTNDATFPVEWADEGEGDGGPHLPEVYRPWSLRYMLSPAHAPAGLEKGKREFREGFRHFVHKNPHHPVTPNSEDRQAQSLVILVFVLAILGMVAGAGFGMEKMQEAAHPEKHLLTLAASLSLPWVLAMGWLVHVALRYFGQAAREPSRQSWRCSAAVWYLLFVPPLTTLNIVVQALWLSSLHSHAGFQASMGRMLPTPGASPWGSRGVGDPGEKSSRLVTLLVAPAVRYTLLGLEAISVLLGLLLLTLCGQHLCAPEVWWATVGLTASTAAVLAAAPAVLLCGYVVSTLGGFKSATAHERLKEEPEWEQEQNG